MAKSTRARSVMPASLQEIDQRYGLEPVFEPGADPRVRPLDESVEVQCPHCWQLHLTHVELCYGRQQHVEDCQHCCHPMLLDIDVIADGAQALVQARRLDAGD